MHQGALRLGSNSNAIALPCRRRFCTTAMLAGSWPTCDCLLWESDYGKAGASRCVGEETRFLAFAVGKRQELYHFEDCTSPASTVACLKG